MLYETASTLITTCKGNRDVEIPTKKNYKLSIVAKQMTNNKQTSKIIANQEIFLEIKSNLVILKITGNYS